MDATMRLGVRRSCRRRAPHGPQRLVPTDVLPAVWCHLRLTRYLHYLAAVPRSFTLLTTYGGRRTSHRRLARSEESDSEAILSAIQGALR